MAKKKAKKTTLPIKAAKKPVKKTARKAAVTRKKPVTPIAKKKTSKKTKAA